MNEAGRGVVAAPASVELVESRFLLNRRRDLSPDAVMVDAVAGFAVAAVARKLEIRYNYCLGGKRSYAGFAKFGFLAFGDNFHVHGFFLESGSRKSVKAYGVLVRIPSFDQGVSLFFRCNCYRTLRRAPYSALPVSSWMVSWVLASV